MARRGGRQKKAFAELVAKKGVSPAEELMERLRWVREEIDRVENGSGIADYLGGNGSSGDARGKILGRLRREAYEIARELLPYEYPKLKSAEHEHRMEAETLADFLRAANERRRASDSDD